MKEWHIMFDDGRYASSHIHVDGEVLTQQDENTIIVDGVTISVGGTIEKITVVNEQ